ncbi:hypothetical protein C8Q80DRAFT_1099245 [Daedaleopsis nitida]|nr:hypothetical protein C8Q80DRAFT_1099245 [Daedaleopsis nitida]
MSIQCPTYISARSAEVILSDVRPIKLKPEALHSINVLLDEILYSILSVSRSLSTDKIKPALLRVLPTGLGKEALLEAEVELKAYWDRTGTTRPSSSTRNGDGSAFDLQWSFELLRLKCEAYSTMNDSDEDADAEKRLQQRMEATGSTAPPNSALMAPAALYTTAILEYVHVLSNVSRVAARDSGRTLATVQDLFIALGEDDAIYGMFKNMKVYKHIEALSRVQRERRSKSFSRSTDKIAGVPRTSTSSPLGEESTAAPAKSRVSTESQKSTVVGSTSDSRRTSIEKGKGAKIFHSRTPSDKHEPANAALARSQSENGINRDYAEFEANEELQQEFDELMKSGATMKVSLTPDRLKSMEVYKQERHERERMNRRAGQVIEKAQDGGVAGSVMVPLPPIPTDSKRPANGNGRPLRHVDSIVEDEEEYSSSNNARQSPFQSNAAARMRNASFTAASASSRAAADLRLRSISISNVPHPRHEDGITRKTSSARHVVPGKVGSQNSAPVVSSQPGMPKRKGKVQKSRESMDLDEVMGGSEGEEELVSPSPRNGTRSSEPSTPKKPHISSAAQDLIAFLDAGPPEDNGYNPSINGSVLSFESSKTRTGRLQRMMSKLTLGGSRESLNGSIAEEPPKTPRSLSRKSSKIHTTSPPPPSYKASSLNRQRSIPNVANASNPYPNVVVATPPPRPTVLQTASSIIAAQPISTASSSQNSTEEFISSQPSSLSRRNTARKAVPPLEDSTVSPSSSIATDSIAEGRLANGHRHGRATDEGVDGTPATSPISSPVARKPIVLNGHPVKLDTSDVTSRPRSALLTSPTATIDRRSVHAKAESGYASRSASRSPITPSEPPPPPPVPPAPTIAASEAEDLRRLMNVATSAEECRLLVDMFLVKSGVPIKDPAPVPVPEDSPTTAKSSLEEALALATKGNDDVERGLVALFLGGGGQVDSSAFPLQRAEQRELEQQQQRGDVTVTA